MPVNKKAFLILLFYLLSFCPFVIAEQHKAYPSTQSKYSFRPCELKDYGAPKETEVPSCEQSSCIELHDGAKICKCMPKEITSASTENARFIFLQNNQTMGSWPAWAFLREVDDFQLLEGDLDSDGNKEVIIANRDSASNGLGVMSWTVFFLKDLRKFETPVSLGVEDYGPGTFTKLRGERGCRILQTRWDMDRRDPTGRRGRGTYFVGRWFRYRHGKLSPLKGEPELKRRLLKSFEDEFVNFDPHTKVSPYTYMRSPFNWLKIRNR